MITQEIPAKSIVERSANAKRDMDCSSKNMRNERQSIIVTPPGETGNPDESLNLRRQVRFNAGATA
jgi:hypothetical protein